MKFKIFTLFTLLSALSTLNSCGKFNNNARDEMLGKEAVQSPPSQTDQDSTQRDPSQGSIPQAIGFYSKGSMINSNHLPNEGLGYVKILRPRERSYSSFDLNYFLNKISLEIHKQFPNGERMQIGDMSEARGGFAYGHVSHQNGLDVDVAYFRRNYTEQDPNSSNGFEEFFVIDGKLSTNFDMQRNWALVKAAVDTKRISRIFVNAVIKNAFCEYAKKTGEYSPSNEYLRRLRPYDGHMDHFHFRISCPAKSKDCVTQEEVPAGSGC